MDALLKAQLLRPGETDTYVLNTNFTSYVVGEDSAARVSCIRRKRVRLQLNVPVKLEVKKEQDELQKSVEDDRKLVIQACIVRTMKSRNRMRHTELLEQVIQQLSTRFKPTIPAIKRCIDALIEKVRT
jgi:membrane-bound lytic murein transglycosylase MltF